MARGCSERIPPRAFLGAHCRAWRCAALRVAFSGLVLTWHEPRVGSYCPTVGEAHGIFEDQDEGQGGERSDALHLSEQLRFGVEFFGRSESKRRPKASGVVRSL